MSMKITLCGCAIALACTAGISAQGTPEWEEYTRYYEDDSWYDITEWFDGNDYNPTDEAWWRWDDEVYEAAEDVSGDKDSDFTYGYVGTRGDDDWFYDYYDPYWSYDTTNDFGWRYYDYDNDGSYDASIWYSDFDDDGLYEHFTYYTYSDAGSQQQKQQAKSEAPKQAKPQQVSGTIDQVKQVETRDAKHTVVSVKTDQGQTILADLGKSTQLSGVNVKSAEKISLQGPMAKVGDKNVVLAQSFQLGSKTHQVNRDRREVTGTVKQTKTVTVRGKEHLIAMVQPSGKDTKMAVDLGPADRLNMNLKEGSNITFTGVPIKVQDTRLVMAQSVKKDGQTVSIDRRSKTSQSGTQGSTTPNQRQPQSNQ